jgi:PAS domain S-box-containing protein
MNQNRTTEKTNQIARNEPTVEQQSESMPADSEKTSNTLRTELIKFKHIQAELVLGLQKQAAELKRVNEALVKDAIEHVQAAETHQAIMANMGEGLYTLDTGGLVTYMNHAAERLFGWSSTELLGRKMHDVTHYRYPDGRPFPAKECPGLQVLEAGTVLSNHEDVFIRKDGTFFSVVYSSSPVASNNAIVGLVVVFRDVTAQKQTEEALRTSRQNLRALAARLQATHEAERSFLAREIHDEISGSLTALKMDLALLPARADKHRDLLLDKVGSMSALIDRTLARVQTIVTELRPVVLDKLGLVAAVEWQTREFQERSGIACEIHLPAQEVPLDHDRATAVFRILQEALTNIARHSGADKARVDLRSEAGSLILDVRDNGKGIEEKAIDAHSAMGLLGMRERAMSFEGAIKITALPEGGTLVSVTIPLK